MVFYYSRLRRRDVHHIAPERRGRSCGMESVLNVAQQLVDVLARDDQSSLLGFVQLPWVSSLHDFQSCLGHDFSKCYLFRGVIYPVERSRVDSHTRYTLSATPLRIPPHAARLSAAYAALDTD